MTFCRAECNKRGFYPTPRGVFGGCFRCGASKMRNCFCYEDLDAKRRNTELNDSYLASSSPGQRFDYSWRSQEEDSSGKSQPRDLANSSRWEQKKDAIRSRSASTPPMSSVDEIQATLQRLKEMREQGLIDEDE